MLTNARIFYVQNSEKATKSKEQMRQKLINYYKTEKVLVIPYDILNGRRYCFKCR